MVDFSQTMHVASPQSAVKIAGIDGVEGLVGRELSGYSEFLAATELYSRVFAYQGPGFELNTNLLCALAGNGGSAVGVFTPDNVLVGFAYGFTGREADGSDYHYSQSAVVAAEYQSKGIGRQLKVLQRTVAQRYRAHSMRWTFDPLLTRNGHFNFATLGAVGTRFYNNYYCRPDTDRLLVEWALGTGEDPYAAARQLATPQLDQTSWGTAIAHEGAVWVPLPAVPERSLELNLRPKLAETLHDVLADDMVLIDCRRLNADVATYLAVPRTGNAAVSASAHP